MSNMSYCRFKNTLGDLRDCLDSLMDGSAFNKDMMDDERKARDNLISLCRDVYLEFSDEVINESDDEY